MKRLTTEAFVTRARDVHGDTYDYSQTEYVKASEPVTIICPVHGPFLQRPNKHLSGQGCPECSRATRSQGQAMGAEEFVTRARAVHGDAYDYSRVDYHNNRTKVEIICPAHGPFMQTPGKHLQGNGCPSCGHSRSALDPTGAIAEKRRATMLERYGTDNPMRVQAMKAVQAATCMERYGAASPLGSDEVRARIMNTNRERYGGRGPLCSPAVQARSLATCIDRYGVANPMQDAEVKARVQQTVCDRYGVSNVMELTSVRDEVRNTKAVRGTFHRSEPEEKLYAMLCEQFGAEDVVRQFSCNDYPFACDFYIKSRQLYIELNAFWSHGGHWFDSHDARDVAVIDDWRAHDESDHYKNAIKVWGEADVRKREQARANQLNYVVFWSSDLLDVELWFALGCPDGSDWDTMYSWLPVRELEAPEQPRELTGGFRNVTALARWFQFNEVYQRELSLWRANSAVSSWGTIQARLYANRWKYLGKLPQELTDIEIIRGLTIAGFVRGYTVFDNTLMRKVLDEFSIESVYDPCAGWGERMLTCAAHGVEYTGVDVNEALASGYAAMIEDMALQNCSFTVGDAAIVAPPRVDAVITCPPYGSTEVYSENGAENLSDEDFIRWWRQVVGRVSGRRIEWFCFQINQRWLGPMSEQVEDFGYQLVKRYDAPVKSSHFNRKGGANTKREFESMLVFHKG